jgi:hypothetical protein
MIAPMAKYAKSAQYGAKGTSDFRESGFAYAEEICLVQIRSP